MLHRQAASSINGLAPLVEQILSNRLDTVEFFEMGEDAPQVVPEVSDGIRDQIRRIGELAAGLEGQPDPKADYLRQVVADKQVEANNKILVFSTFRHTLAYLQRQASTWGVRVAVVHGAVADEDRHALRRRFKLPKDNPDTIDLMLCSEVGTEGLDYQSCNTLVNFDIPWNPMRIEQRSSAVTRCTTGPSSPPSTPVTARPSRPSNRVVSLTMPVALLFPGGPGSPMVSDTPDGYMVASLTTPREATN